MRNYCLLFIIAVLVPFCYRENMSFNFNSEYNKTIQENSDTSVVLKIKQPGTDYLKYKKVELEDVSDTILVAADRNFDFLDQQSKSLNLKLDKYLKKKYNYHNETVLDTINTNRAKTCNRPKLELGMIKDSTLLLYYVL